ncbi:MAG: CDP-alcohol phosphatidyltransferase family protein [Proteobacteria bacterium]|nr:CDP-alcohol phosphatidyltransferase family protein [Pseudomonadota bacterium]
MKSCESTHYASRSLKSVGPSLQSAGRSVSSWTLRKSLKELAVEEPVNRYLHRPLAFALIRPLEHLSLPISPNHITLLSGALGLGAAASCYHVIEGGPGFAVLGALLLFLSVVLDCADGMLARLRGGGSRFGMLLDGFIDLVVGVSIWYALARTSVTYLGGGGWAWPLAVLVLVSIVVHCAFYDQYKERYTRNVTTQVRSPHRGEPTAAGARGGFVRLAGRLHRLYETIVGSPEAGTLRRPDVDAAAYRRALARPMALMRWLGLGSNLTVMYVAILLSAWQPMAPWWLGHIVINGAMNAMLIVAVVSWKRAEQGLGPATK